MENHTIPMLDLKAQYVALKPELDDAVMRVIESAHFINGLGDAGRITLPELTSTSPWLWIASLVVGGVLAFVIAKFRSIRPGSTPPQARPGGTDSMSPNGYR